MTDWFMTEMDGDVFSAVDNGHSLCYGKTIPHECTWAANDMVMPGCDEDRENIIAHVKDGSVALAELQ